MCIPSVGAFLKTLLTTSTSGNTTAIGCSTHQKSLEALCARTEALCARTQLNLRGHLYSITKRMKCNSTGNGETDTYPSRQFQQCDSTLRENTGGFCRSYFLC